MMFMSKILVLVLVFIFVPDVYSTALVVLMGAKGATATARLKKPKGAQHVRKKTCKQDFLDFKQKKETRKKSGILN